ncbi:MAG TPA: phosphoribosylaminoimidazolesuccinocarboxamide synthase [Pyrodictium sp.]|nr:phosphoribosylaminoimidazolesuccinocarboxamide synthase [Pyrodictium sp.]
MLVYEGKAKKLYDLGNGTARLVFKDEVTAFNGARREVVSGKGVLSAKTSSRLFEILEDNGIPTHYICYEGGASVRVRLAKVIPLEVIVRNYAYGSMLKRMPLLKKLARLSKPIVELHFKSDEAGDPLILPEDAIEAKIIDWSVWDEIKSLALKANSVLTNLFEKKGLKLIDFKIEVGWVDSRLVVIDEISGDTIRVIDEKGEHLDKELFRKGASGKQLLEAYKRLQTIVGEPERVCSDASLQS